MTARRGWRHPDAETLCITIVRGWERATINKTRVEIAAELGWSLDRLRNAFRYAAAAGLVRVLSGRARAYAPSQRAIRHVADRGFVRAVRGAA